MRVALSVYGAAVPELWVVLCLPFDVRPEAALADLDVVSETLRWSVDENVDLALQAVWLDGDHSPTMDEWLAELR
jgi:hypothetical protein